MATITVNPSDVTVSSGTFSTSGSGSISWTAPTIPSGATVTSCVLTGKATASSTSVKTIKVNNQSVSVSTSGASFSIDLSDSVVTQSVPVAIEDKSWSNTNVKFTNMVYTITYTDTEAANPTITFTQNSGGYILYNGTTYENNFTLTLKRNSNIDFSIYANDGYYIKSTDDGVLGTRTYGEDTTSIENISLDMTIDYNYTIVYERKSTGTTNNIHIGDFNIKTIYLGDTPIAAAYLGDKKLL